MGVFVRGIVFIGKLNIFSLILNTHNYMKWRCRKVMKLLKFVIKYSIFAQNKIKRNDEEEKDFTIDKM